MDTNATALEQRLDDDRPLYSVSAVPRVQNSTLGCLHPKHLRYALRHTFVAREGESMRRRANVWYCQQVKKRSGINFRRSVATRANREINAYATEIGPISRQERGR